METRRFMFESHENQTVGVHITNGGIFCKGGFGEILEFDMTITHFYCSCYETEDKCCINFSMNDNFALQRGDFEHYQYGNIIPLTAFQAMPKPIKDLQLRIWGV